MKATRKVKVAATKSKGATNMPSMKMPGGPKGMPHMTPSLGLKGMKK